MYLAQQISGIMKNLLTLFLAAYTAFSFGQLNMTQIGYLDLGAMHSTELNDIWGYTDEDGNEYAIVGCFDGTSVVDISDPTTPTEVAWIPGMNSIWRDIKTVGDYAYVTTEANEGLLIIDLSPLPASTVLPTAYYTGPAGDPWQSAHNVWADGEDGYVYICGANRGAGGVIILDVSVDPMAPVEVGVYDTWYAHDIYVRNDTGYASHVYDGFFSIVDLTDKSAPAFINSAPTIDGVSHNAWLSLDGNYLFTTDEDPDGYIASYDISDPMDIILVDQIQSSPGSAIIPHNVHVLGNYLVTSYYTDGVVVHDASDPTNLVEVANFDTSPIFSGPTYNGCWGVYPFFTSELLVAADTEEGLYVLGTDFLYASYLEGIVTDIDTDLPLNGVEITITGPGDIGYSNVLGDYSIGTFAEGTYTVTYTKTDYYPESFPVYLENGLVAVQDVQMNKIPNYSIDVTVLDAATLDPIENAEVRIQHTLESETVFTNAAGVATVDLYYDDNYDVYAGQWGYVTACLGPVYLDAAAADITLYLDKGIYDDFTFDFGWTSGGDAVNGLWEREVPVGIIAAGATESPSDDVTDDCADHAYLTGNGTTVSGADEVDSGMVYLHSPEFDLTSSYINPGINFSTFFANHNGAVSANDSLVVYLTNGTDTALVYMRDSLSDPVGTWVDYSFKVEDYMFPSATMKLIVEVGDDTLYPHIVEAGLDHFYVEELSLADADENPISSIVLYPNPVTDELYLSGISEGRVSFVDVSGRVCAEITIAAGMDVSGLKRGLYFVQVYTVENELLDVLRVVKE